MAKKKSTNPTSVDQVQKKVDSYYGSACSVYMTMPMEEVDSNKSKITSVKKSLEKSRQNINSIPVSGIKDKTKQKEAQNYINEYADKIQQWVNEADRKLNNINSGADKKREGSSATDQLSQAKIDISPIMTNVESTYKSSINVSKNTAEAISQLQGYKQKLVDYSAKIISISYKYKNVDASVKKYFDECTKKINQYIDSINTNINLITTNAKNAQEKDSNKTNNPPNDKNFFNILNKNLELAKKEYDKAFSTISYKDVKKIIEDIKQYKNEIDLEYSNYKRTVVNSGEQKTQRFIDNEKIYNSGIKTLQTYLDDLQKKYDELFNIYLKAQEQGKGISEEITDKNGNIITVYMSSDQYKAFEKAKTDGDYDKIKEILKKSKDESGKSISNKNIEAYIETFKNSQERKDIIKNNDDEYRYTLFLDSIKEYKSLINKYSGQAYKFEEHVGDTPDKVNELIENLNSLIFNIRNDEQLIKQNGNKELNSLLSQLLTLESQAQTILENLSDNSQSRTTVEKQNNMAALDYKEGQELIWKNIYVGGSTNISIYTELLDKLKDNANPHEDPVKSFNEVWTLIEGSTICSEKTCEEYTKVDKKQSSQKSSSTTKKQKDNKSGDKNKNSSRKR